MFGFGAQSSAYTLDENQVVLNLDAQETTFKVKQIEGKKIACDNELLVASETMLKTCQFNGSVTPENRLILAGCLPRGQFTLKFAIANPKLKFEQVVQDELKSLNIAFKGQIETLSSKPENLKMLSLHVSEKLSVLIKYMLETSDNLYAQTLLRTIGYKTLNIGSIVSGKNTMLDILHKNLALDTATIQLEDGAGMSENDLLNADFISALLYKMQDKKSFESFIMALPIYGKSGTLASRKEELLKGNVMAKTGTGTVSAALSGYISAKSGKVYIFSILATNLLGAQKKQVLKLQDRVLLALYNDDSTKALPLPLT